MLKPVKNPSQKVSRTCLLLLTPTQLGIVFSINYKLSAQLKLIILQKLGVYEEYKLHSPEIYAVKPRSICRYQQQQRQQQQQQQHFKVRSQVMTLEIVRVELNWKSFVMKIDIWLCSNLWIFWYHLSAVANKIAKHIFSSCTNLKKLRKWST